jgi:hypothetical protein
MLAPTYSGVAGKLAGSDVGLPARAIGRNPRLSAPVAPGQLWLAVSCRANGMKASWISLFGSPLACRTKS